MLTFKNRDDYMAQRTALITEAENNLNNGKVEDANKKMDSVKELDKGFDDYAKMQANLRALSDIRNPSPILFNDEQWNGLNNNEDDIYNSKDYRIAFMNYVTNGVKIPNEYRNADANTKTSDVGAVIPTVDLERIIEKIENTGHILALVTRTAYKGGVSIPTSNVKPTASWVSEGSGSDRQKKTTGTLTFAYHKLRCAISVSLETDTMALAVFETTFVNNVVEAMTKALEQSIISGDGSGKPKGILAETVADGQNVDIKEGDSITYADLINMEAKLPAAYESGAKWFMTKPTFMHIMGMTDSNGQPVARVNYGLNGANERNILGRQVVLTDGYMSNYSTSVTADEIIAFLFNPADYILNTNLNMTIKEFEDNNTDDIVKKAIMLVDGKVVDNNSLVTMTLKNA